MYTPVYYTLFKGEDSFVESGVFDWDEDFDDSNLSRE